MERSEKKVCERVEVNAARVDLDAGENVEAAVKVSFGARKAGGVDVRSKTGTR